MKEGNKLVVDGSFKYVDKKTRNTGIIILERFAVPTILRKSGSPRSHINTIVRCCHDQVFM